MFVEEKEFENAIKRSYSWWKILEGVGGAATKLKVGRASLRARVRGGGEE